MRNFLFLFFLILLASPFANAQLPDTDVWLITLTDAGEISTVKNITNREGYDNQARFMPDGKSILYTSIGEDGQADVFQYFIKKGKIKQITKTKESEYSPTPLLDGKSFYTLQVSIDSVQAIWKYGLKGGKKEAFRPGLTNVGYFCILPNQSVITFMLGAPNELQETSPAGEIKLIAQDPGRCILKVPASENTIYYVQKGPANMIMEYQVGVNASKGVAPCMDGSEDFAFLPGGKIVMGQKGILYRWDETKTKWEPWLDLTMKGITDFYRIAVDMEGKQIIVISYTGKKP